MRVPLILPRKAALELTTSVVGLQVSPISQKNTNLLGSFRAPPPELVEVDHHEGEEGDPGERQVQLTGRDLFAQGSGLREAFTGYVTTRLRTLGF